MARYIGPRCKLCRREGAQLFLRGERCYSDKCSFQRRKYTPGQHPKKSVKLSEYGIRLREKQKVKRIFGILEAQFRRYFDMASRQKGETGANLLILLERRLDNTVYRAGFASSRSEARQLVKHRHFLVNGKRVDIPSYLLKAGDCIEVREKSKKIKKIVESIEAVQRRGVPEWLELDKLNLKVTIKEIPKREQLPEKDIKENLIVEFYSR